MNGLYDVLKAPLLTERGTMLKDEKNVYVFKVDNKANRQEVKKAVETFYDVEVLGVRTLIARGKVKKMGRTEFKRKNWKKAFVTLKQGQTLNVIEGL